MLTGYRHSYMYPVYGDLNFWCLFDGNTWLCMNATNINLSIQPVI